ncbi:hypothetical protein ACFL4E_01085 [Candidatus Omnitrophota bacterium]
MNSSVDWGAIILSIIFGGTIVFLVYFLFDIQNIFKNIKTQKYLRGYPSSESLSPSDGIIEVRDKEVAFKEPAGEKEYFTIPIERINNVLVEREGEGSSRGVLGSLSSIFAERQYLYIEFNHDERWHTVQFSAHKASSVNDEVMNKILEARNRLTVAR